MPETINEFESQQKNSNAQIIKGYTVQRGQGIFRVFINLGLNYNKNTETEISKLNSILTKGHSKSKPLGIKEGDIFELDTDFVVHLKRDGNEIFKYPLIDIEKKELAEKKESAKLELIAGSREKILTHKNEQVMSRYKELVAELNERNMQKYYLELAREEMEEENPKIEIKDPPKIKETEKIQKNENNKKTIPEKKERQPEIKDKNKKTRERIYVVKQEIKKGGILLSKEMKRNILNYIEGRNPLFKKQLGHVYDIAKEYNLHPALLIAVMQNETHMGKKTYSKNNFGNIGNTDEKVALKKKGIEFSSPRSGIKAVAKSIRTRVDAYYEEFGKNSSPTPKEIMTGIGKNGKQFYKYRWMQDDKGDEVVQSIYNQIACK